MVNSVLSSGILILCFLANGCGFGTVRVPTGAMQPTIPIDSYILWDADAYRNHSDIKRFDLVLHTLPTDEKRQKPGISENTRFIFRVIGLGSEKIEIKNGQVLINNRILDEPFEKISFDDNFGPIAIPENEYFLLGDNRAESEDSRYWKPSTIEKERIIAHELGHFFAQSLENPKSRLEEEVLANDFAKQILQR